MIIKRNCLFIVMAIMSILICNFDIYALSAKKDLSGIANEANYIIVGTVAESKALFKQEKDSQGKIMPSVKIEGYLYKINVKKVPFSDNSLLEKKEIYMFIMKKLIQIPPFRT